MQPCQLIVLQHQYNRDTQPIRGRLILFLNEVVGRLEDVPPLIYVFIRD
jgi:hypothetical protein